MRGSFEKYAITPANVRKDMQRFYESGDASRLNVPNPDRIRRILLALNAARLPDEMDVPGFHYRQLTGRGRDSGRYAVDASGNWRVTFAWQRYDAIDVALEDS